VSAATSLASSPPAAPSYQPRPAPRREPPFEDELPTRQSGLLGPADQQLPFRAPDPGAPSTLRLAVLPDRFDARPTGRSDLPPPAAFARRLLIGVIEAATGRRSASQLSRHTTPTVQTGLARDAGKISRLEPRPDRRRCTRCTWPSRPTGWPRSWQWSGSGPGSGRSRSGWRAWTAAGDASDCRSAEPGPSDERRPGSGGSCPALSACACCRGCPGSGSPGAAWRWCPAGCRLPVEQVARCAPRVRPSRAPARCR
jgi:hypothetical protein